MKPLPLTPDRVRTLCAELGFRAQPGLTDAELKTLAHHKPNGIQSDEIGPQLPRSKRRQPCACGKMGLHRIGADWECERCRRNRARYEKEGLRLVKNGRAEVNAEAEGQGREQ